jgi:enoyl-CoA hydratase/carnithine racemase
MSETLIELNITDRVGRLVLQRPATGNAFNGPMVAQLLDALRRANGEADILVISAAGDDFSLGRDRNEPKGAHPPFDAFSLITDVNTTLSSFPGIVLSAVQGRAFGFAVGLVMKSDLAIAAEGARFAFDEVQKGIPPMFIMAEIFDHVPPKSALDWILSGREVSANEAHGLGLLSRVVPDDRLQAAVEDLVRELRLRDAAVLRACKRYAGAIAQVPRPARAAVALVEQTRFAEGKR